MSIELLMLKFVDSWLNSITMYRLLVYVLLADLGFATLLSWKGLLPFSPTALLVSVGILYLASNISNKILAKIWRVDPNVESATITALILSLVLFPADNLSKLWWLVGFALVAMASKFLITFDRRHLFNPAALAMFALSLAGSPDVGWWVSSSVMLPVTLISGLLVIKKLRRSDLFMAFLIAVTIGTTMLARTNEMDLLDMFLTVFTSWPVIFFGTIMLTEPQTMASKESTRWLYAFIVGVLFTSNFSWGPIYSTPELSLLIGNIFVFIFSSRAKWKLSIKEIVQLAPGTYELIFYPNKKVNFVPGQFMEWTLGHDNVDNRGNRRYFTIASSPTEESVRLGVKFNQDRSSSYKTALLNPSVRKKVVATSLQGDFVLPKNLSKKLVFIAGGIGITPFRSMVKYMLDKSENRSIVMFYVNKHEDDIVYRDVFEKATSLGLKIVYVLTDLERAPKVWHGKLGHLDQKMLEEEVPDFKERTFYISGPNSMVDSFTKQLSSIGVRGDQVVTDYFPGY